MSSFEVDSERVHQASSAVGSSAAAVNTEVDTMMRHLTALEECWRGSASSSFQQVVAEWRSVQEKVRESLLNINQSLAAAGRGYAEVEAANTRLFSH
ncbi:WXG100 family type VII secretion target [Spelaeicoccus albus]|uniref:ESAT-6-like protein n=1 Tax=Spelaeicoccus albus TaxID=1280376 RepID=A0A7Z0A996_9MICO|nr:WXG100 family type VII secretion target [Spelaeicoccus albus]NYI65928.1 WXG100 family type VII secretion target [Spelaeicoccus albus]